MCCIFTCCGWMVDLIQRAWVFAMSCCISSAVCCVLMTSSMSGVALGYNYSLAEYIDLKETNVSVYLKRGIFDDEVSDDMGFRRSGGHKAVRQYLKDDENLVTGASENADDGIAQSGRRRLDDSILESNNNNKFEGSLMKLTASPPYPLTTTEPVTRDVKMAGIVTQYTEGSLDQLKAIQNLINMRKVQAARDHNDKRTTQPIPPLDEHYVPHFPAMPDQARRMMGGLPSYNRPVDVNPAIFAVPDSSINEQAKWKNPKLYSLSPAFRKSMDYELGAPTYPNPIVVNTGPVRPTRPSSWGPTHTATTQEPSMIKAIKERLNLFEENKEEPKEKSILDKYDLSRRKTEKPKPFDYYEEDIKGLPVRKKRSIIQIKKRVTPRVESSSKKEENKMPNEISNYPSLLMRRLLLSNEKGTSESLKSAVNVLNSSTDKMVKILQLMFS